MDSSIDVRARRLLSVVRADAGGALLVGLGMLAFRVPIASLYGMSITWVAGLATVNLAYSSIGITLLMRGMQPSWRVWGLIGANAGWTLVAWSLAWAVRQNVSPFGIAHLVIEGAYVLGLACVEAKLVLALKNR